jgi:hypothetical protein
MATLLQAQQASGAKTAAMKWKRTPLPILIHSPQFSARRYALSN